jgi:hypothetical protein
MIHRVTDPAFGGYHGSADRAIVAPEASYTVADRRRGLWIVPDLWKTHTLRFPQGPWTAQRPRRPQRSTGHHSFSFYG